MNSIDRRSLLKGLGAGAALGALAPWARAQSQAYPNKPLRIIVATVAGSGPDIATRQMAAALAEILKQPVVVENRAGGNGTIAAAEVARAPKDGYTLLDANIGNAINDLLRPEAGSRLIQDLTPITDLTLSPLILVVNAALPVKTVKELIDYARANPKALNYASGGPGSLIQLTGERIKRATGIELTEVPYKSFGADIVDLLANHVQVGFGVWSLIGQHIRSGKLRALGVAGTQRIPLASEIPTFAEAGLPDITATGWNGIFVPAGTPDAIVQTLGKAVIAAVNTAPFQQFFLKDGVEIGGKSPEQFAAFIRSEKAHYGKIITDANIKLE
jgi:tripartite-type tricarboxylate transporter receptor subunit TctC